MQDLLDDRDNQHNYENNNSSSDEQEDPNMAAELLRQKIEETNQKISDYFKQQQRLAASQTKQQ